MALIDENSEYRMYSYECTELSLLFGEENSRTTLQLKPYRLNSMTIMSDYITNLFPVIKIEMVLEPSLYYEILENKNTARIQIRIDKFYRKISESEKSLMYSFMNSTFGFILDDNESDVYETAKRENNNLELDNVYRDDSDDLYKTSNKVEFYLFNEDSVSPMEVTLNKVLRSARVQDAYAYIFNKIGIKKVLMGQMDNTKEYDFLFLPNLKAKQLIRFLDTYYGTWKDGMMAFCDYDRSYFMKMSAECTVYESGEVQDTCIIIPDISTSYSNNLCTVVRDDSSAVNYIVGDNKTISTRNDSISNNYVNSSDVTVVNNITGETSSSDSNVTTKNGSSKRVVVSNTENDWISNIYEKMSSSNSRVVDVGLADYDIDAVKPNKKFTLYFTNTKSGKKYKGNYFLGKATHYFLKDGSEFKLNSSITLRVDN